MGNITEAGLGLTLPLFGSIRNTCPWNRPPWSLQPWDMLALHNSGNSYSARLDSLYPEITSRVTQLAGKNTIQEQRASQKIRSAERIMIRRSRRAAAITPRLSGSLTSSAAVAERHNLGTVGLATSKRQDQNETGGSRISNYSFSLLPPDKSDSLDSLTRITDSLSLMLTVCLYV